MPFVLSPTSVRHEGDETVVEGHITHGAFVGPEALALRAADNRQCESRVLAHGLLHPEGWPVVPAHTRTVVRLSLPRLPEDFDLCLVTGKGSIGPDRPRLDVSGYLGEREFWAMQLAIHCGVHIDDPGSQFVGVTAEASDDWYRTHIDASITRGVWPCIRLPVRGGFYVELEMAADVDYQDRIYIGHASEARRVLLGYHSGHFSLPALRLAEFEALAARSPANAGSLLWLRATYLVAGERPLALVRDLVSRIPGVVTSQIDLLAETYLDGLSVDALRWTRDPALGWVNNWGYSQRNPASSMTVLSREDFAFIERFFGGIA